jgi:hypothetical protein
MKTKLDFLLIGAAKTGTTSLFQYLRGHPEVHLPPEKEAPFFSHDSEYVRGWDWFVRSKFRDAPAEKKWGKVTPYYMAGAPLRSPDAEPPEWERGMPLERIVPERIKRDLPDVKLIAVLRDPVDRCISNYRMVVKKGYETREFAESIEALLSPEALEAARRDPQREDSSVVRGEYGRVLNDYFDLFPREQILVLFTDELERDPAAVCRRIFEFIGVDPDHEPENIGRRYHRGGEKRFEWLDLARFEQRMADSRPIRSLWYRFPQGFRDRVYRRFHQARFRVYQWNSVPREVEFEVDPEVELALRRHYADDGRKLRELLGVELPWELAETPSPAPTP